MNIKTSDLQEFSRLSSPLKGHENVLPILDYVKVGNGKLLKTVLTSFVEIDCADATEEMLLDEKQLSIKVKGSKADFLNFKKKDNKVTVTDSVIPSTFQIPDAKTFPVIPTPTSGKYPVSKNFLSVLKKAQIFSLPPNYSNLSWMSFVMVGNGYVCSSDGVIMFTEPVEEQFKMVLDKDDAKALSALDITHFSESDSYMFFYGDRVTLGFSKVDLFSYVDIIAYGDSKKGKMEFSLSASDMQDFNWQIIKAPKTPYVLLTKGKKYRNDADLDIYSDRLLESLPP